MSGDSVPAAVQGKFASLSRSGWRAIAPPAGGIDGVDLTVADVAWLRRQIGAALQESILFNRTIRENVAFADPGMACRLNLIPSGGGVRLRLEDRSVRRFLVFRALAAKPGLTGPGKL